MIYYWSCFEMKIVKVIILFNAFPVCYLMAMFIVLMSYSMLNWQFKVTGDAILSICSMDFWKCSYWSIVSRTKETVTGSSLLQRAKLLISNENKKLQPGMLRFNVELDPWTFIDHFMWRFDFLIYFFHFIVKS